MAVTVGSIVATAGSGDNPQVASLNVGTADDRAVMALSWTFSNSGRDTVDGEYNNVELSLTTPADAGDGLSYQALYGLTTATGANDLEAWASGAFGSGVVHGVPASGVASFRTVGVNTGFGTAPTITIATQAGDIVVLLGTDSGNLRTFTEGAGQTLLSATGNNFGSYIEATGTSTTIAGTLDNNATWKVAAFVLVPAGGGGGSASGAAAHYYRQMQ